LLKTITSREAGQDGLRAGVALFVKGNGLLNLGVRHTRFFHSSFDDLPIGHSSIEKSQLFAEGYRLGARLHVQLGIDVADVPLYGGYRYE